MLFWASKMIAFMGEGEISTTKYKVNFKYASKS